MLHWLLPLLLIIGLPVAAQQSSPKTYAVIAGISTYASKGIPSLRFANRDAEAFYNYLRDDAKVSPDNMKLLMNDEATTAAVYSALSWLNEVATKNDLVYFYFSGHGDMENETIYKLGFLLTHNTPRTNYINNAIRIEDINNFANTLSLKNKAKVVIITDACHSGNLAGSDFRGSSLVGKSLSVSKANEIRIASCRPDQESMEDEGWGGGRGVFSFHLVNGLIGFAAKRNNDVITVKDLRRYLDSTLAKDVILKREKHQQNAVIDGPDVFPLAKKNNQRVSQISQAGMNAAIAPPIVQSAGGESVEVMMDEFATWVKKQKLDIGFNYAALQSLPADSITGRWLDMWRLKINGDLDTAMSDEQLILNGMVNRVVKIRKSVTADIDIRKQMNRILAISLHDFSQKAINAYLEGDAAELERRRYYNAGSSGYDTYPIMYDIAMKLTEPEDFLYHLLEVNKYYFGGLALLIKIPMTADPVPLIDEAYQLEKKALELEENAPYIYNILGTLHFYKGEFSMADSLYRKALSMAPQWALPYNNLLGLYITQKKTQEANAIYQKAAEKGNELPDFYTNAGLLKEMQGDYLLAEEMQRKSIFLNSRHYLPFERLGNIYTHTTQYALADSFYFEADVRKRGYHFNRFKSLPVAVVSPMGLKERKVCDFDSTKIQRDDVAGYFTWGMYYFVRKNDAAAEIKWKHLIQLDKSNPIVFYYLGKIQFDKNNREEAELMYKFALQHHLNKEASMLYLQQWLRQSRSLNDTSCFRKTFADAWYPIEEAHAYLGTLYREWHHYTEAEEQFRRLITLMPADFAANKTLWKLLEQVGKYSDAENAIKEFGRIDQDRSDYELNYFYKRMIALYPAQPEWYLKAGVFLYAVVKKNPTGFEKDKKRIFPDQQQPEKVLLAMDPQIVAPSPVRLVGTEEAVRFELPILYPFSDAIHYLLKVDSLTGDNTMLTADINDKLGDLYLWQGVPMYAARHYQASIDASPENAGVRLKLIDAYHITYQYTAALTNLDYLKIHNELNLDKILLLADYSMRQSKFKTADSLLSKGNTIYPYPHRTILDLQARNELLQQKADNAIRKYQLLLLTDTGNAAAMYSISRMYAVKNDIAKTMLWLNKAYENGFRYKWVLANDPLMNGMRQNNQWQVFVTTKQFLQYPEPSNTFPRAFTE